jgi:hypothetical protein
VGGLHAAELVERGLPAATVGEDHRAGNLVAGGGIEAAKQLLGVLTEPAERGELVSGPRRLVNPGRQAPGEVFGQPGLRLGVQADQGPGEVFGEGPVNRHRSGPAAGPAAGRR